MRNNKSSQRGSAMVMSFLVCIMLFGVLCSLSQFSLARSSSAEQIRNHTSMEFAAEGGIRRVQSLLTYGMKTQGSSWFSGKYSEFKAQYEQGSQDFKWLAQQPGERPEFVTDSFGYYRIEGTNYKVRCRIVKLEPEKTDAQSWYQLVSQVTNGKVTYEARCLCQLATSFARYARFVSNGSLSIRQGAEYYGNVYAFSGITCNNESPILFHEDVSTAGVITLDSGATYYKGKIENVPAVPLPGYTDIEAVKNSLTQSSGCEYWSASPADLIFDYKDSAYAAYFKQYTGYTLNPAADNSIYVEINFRGDVMDVTHKFWTGSGYIQFTRSNMEVPHGHVIWVRGYTVLKGNLSKRVTVYTQRRDGGSGGITYITGPIRYVDDSDRPQFKLYSGEGYEASFDSASQTWTHTAEWKVQKTGQVDAYPLYKQDPEWSAPSSGDPVLGIVACKNIYIDGNKFSNSLQQRNLEIHALLYSAEGHVEARYFSTQGYNLIINGSIITVTGNVLSSAYRYRNYLYDRNLQTAAPPRFPTTTKPGFGTYEVKAIYTPPVN